jgi:outer membrane protease
VGGDIGFTKNTKNRLPGTFFDISFKAAIPGITGKMQDQDWTDDQNKNQLTHYSVSENRTNMAYLFDLKSGCVFNKGIMSIKTFSVISGMFFEWSAYGGSMLYPNIDEHNNIITNAQTHFYISDKTEGIRYRQTWIGIGFGVSLYGEFNRFFNVEVSFAATPLVFFKAKDEHLLRDLVIEDEGDLLNGGTQLDAAFALSVRPANIFAISLEVAYRNIFNSQGRSKYTYHGKDMNIAKNYPITWYSGAGYEAFDISLMFKFII